MTTPTSPQNRTPTSPQNRTPTIFQVAALICAGLGVFNFISGLCADPISTPDLVIGSLQLTLAHINWELGSPPSTKPTGASQ